MATSNGIHVSAIIIIITCHSTESPRRLMQSDKAFWLSCVLVSALGELWPVFTPINDIITKKTEIWKIRRSARVFFSKFYPRKIDWPCIFYFFFSSALCFNSHTIWRIHSWKLLSPTTVFHCRPLSSNGGLSASFKGTLSAEESASCFPALILSTGIQTGTLLITSQHL